MPLAALAALWLMPAAYRFPSDKPASYDVTFKFSGFLPIFGGLDSTADVAIGLTVLGEPGDGGNLKAVSDLTDLSVSLGGSKLPFGVDDVKKLYPKNTITFTPGGKLLTTDAPDKPLPIRLPGFDLRHFPESTFLAVEFPADGIEVGKSFHYEKTFGDSPVSFDVTPTQVDDGAIKLDLKFAQSYTTQEDSGHSLVRDPKDVAFTVKTDVKGAGKAEFDPKLGMIRSADIEEDAIGTEHDVAAKTDTPRKMNLKLTVRLR